MQKHHKMLMVKLLLPLWIKQAVKHINEAGAHDPAGRSQKQLSVQVAIHLYFSSLKDSLILGC